MRWEMHKISPCPNCGSKALFRSKEVSAGGGHAPDYLPGLGRTFVAEKFNLVLCSDCGLTRFFARRAATEKVRDSNKWEPV
jgi:predicted nucleic-acid-binding Zn-ribbon protein